MSDILTSPQAPFVDRLRVLCGYVENGSDTAVKIYQDDATRTWCVQVGTGIGRHRTYHGHTLELAFEEAFQDPKNDPYD